MFESPRITYLFLMWKLQSLSFLKVLIWRWGLQSGDGGVGEEVVRARSCWAIVVDLGGTTWRVQARGGEAGRMRLQDVFSASSVMRLITCSTSKETHGLCRCLSCFAGGKWVSKLGEGEGGGGGDDVVF